MVLRAGFESWPSFDGNGKGSNLAIKTENKQHGVFDGRPLGRPQGGWHGFESRCCLKGNYRISGHNWWLSHHGGGHFSSGARLWTNYGFCRISRSERCNMSSTSINYWTNVISLPETCATKPIRLTLGNSNQNWIMKRLGFLEISVKLNSINQASIWTVASWSSGTG